jgi:hypothetical protein
MKEIRKAEEGGSWGSWKRGNYDIRGKKFMGGEFLPADSICMYLKLTAGKCINKHF